MNENVLDRDWSARSLLRFAFPTMAMMLFMGAYTMVDTVFVARFVDTDALSAINIVCPVINLTVGLGTMLASGGNAIVSRAMGAGEYEKAREIFTLLTLAAAAVGGALFAAGMVWLDEIIYILGAGDALFFYCRAYLGTLLFFLPANVMQTWFSNLFVTAGRPGLGLALSVAAGMANIVLDYIFIAVLGLGITGAALGTGFGYLIPAAAGVLYFWRRQGRETLFFVRPGWNMGALMESCMNGSSEMVGQLAAAVTTYLFNITMMRLAGEDGVAAITILIYSQFLLNTLYIGFSMGAAPVIGYNHGRGDVARQRAVLRICLRIIAFLSLAMFLLCVYGGSGIVRLFADDASEVYVLAEEGFHIFSYSFLFCGLNIFTSSMFTALSDGGRSAVLSFLRTFGLLAGGILLLPRFWGTEGVWLAIPLAEGVMFFISVLCLIRFFAQLCYNE